MFMKKKTMFLLTALSVMLVSCGGGSGMPKFGDNEFAVETLGATSASLENSYPATIKGIQDVDVRPKISGFITKIFVHEGEKVAAGQPLFSIDSETYQAVVRQAKAGVNTAKAQLNTAKLTYENNKQLFEKGVIGQYELSAAENTYATAQAGLAQAQANLVSAEETLGWCNITSPAAGYVGDLPYKVGTLVSASNSLTTVSNTSVMEVFFSMSEREILNLTKSAGSVDSALAAFPAVRLKLADGSIYAHEGKVAKISGVINATTGSVSLIARFDNPERLLKSGGAGQIIIPEENNSAIVVPQTACSEIQDKIFVYKVDDKNIAKYSEITVNPQNDGKNYIVTSGLKAGDRIIVKGILKATDGMEIKPITVEQYQKKMDDAAALAEKQGTAAGFIEAMK